jgi:hypothetical protein
MTEPAPTRVLLGYADRFSVQPGETIRFMVSSGAATFSAGLVRLWVTGNVLRRFRGPTPFHAL